MLIQWEDGGEKNGKSVTKKTAAAAAAASMNKI